MAFRAVAVGVVADEPEFVGDAGGQRADLGERDGGRGRGVGQFGDPSGGAAEGPRSLLSQTEQPFKKHDSQLLGGRTMSGFEFLQPSHDFCFAREHPKLLEVTSCWQLSFLGHRVWRIENQVSCRNWPPVWQRAFHALRKRNRVQPLKVDCCVLYCR